MPRGPRAPPGAPSCGRPLFAVPSAPSRLLLQLGAGLVAAPAVPFLTCSLLAQRAEFTQSARRVDSSSRVGTPGFEPGLSGPPDQRLNQAGPRPVALSDAQIIAQSRRSAATQPEGGVRWQR